MSPSLVQQLKFYHQHLRGDLFKKKKKKKKKKLLPKPR